MIDDIENLFKNS